MARHGEARRGEAWLGEARTLLSGGGNRVIEERFGVSRHGEAGHGEARFGSAGQGLFSEWWRNPRDRGRAWNVVAWPGKAGRCEARLGKARKKGGRL